MLAQLMVQLSMGQHSAGTKLNQYGNTSYPLTINQDGSVTSTSFGNIANDPLH
ncbi:hypothetical protein [Lactiplantibacillus plantarum]|uniref:hypothetical protein n=1 Tax=Lactiplantibacillus plantarum TaxID=1590 RepID=UPI000A8FAB19|nr:hypothetical protein [Lactiplantibacillus plantarum]